MNIPTRRSFLKSAIVSPLTVSAAAAGVVEVALDASESWIDLDGRPALLYTFNQQLPGPVIEVQAGDEIRILLRNHLPEATNLHFHGLHVPSTGNADNVMLRAEPGGSIDYRFTIPADHPSGTFWYHPHVHGLAARQVSRGLAGAIVVRNAAEAIPEIERAPESILILQDFDLDRNGRIVEPNFMEQMRGREGWMVTASGSTDPQLSVAQAGWLRLRLINASSSRFYRLRLEEHPFHQIGTDGGLMPSVEMQDEILIAPGERVEAMVKGDRSPEAEYKLLSLPYDRILGGAPGPTTTDPLVLGRLRYEEQTEATWTLPATLKSIDPLPEPTIRRTFQLGQGMGSGAMGRGMAFTINGRTFNPERIDTRSILGSVEEWEFVNPTTMDHPMHMHTDPFQVIGSSGNPVPAWKDTVIVKARSRLAVRTALRDFAGVRMYHCHILDHEDLGMMGTLEVRE